MFKFLFIQFVATTSFSIIQNGNTLTTSIAQLSMVRPNGLINGAGSYQFSPQENGQFWVEVVDSTGYTGSSLMILFQHQQSIMT